MDQGNVVLEIHRERDYYIDTDCLYDYRKVASRSTSRLVAHPRSFKLFMKGKFDAYVLGPLAQRVQN